MLHGSNSKSIFGLWYSMDRQPSALMELRQSLANVSWVGFIPMIMTIVAIIITVVATLTVFFILRTIIEEPIKIGAILSLNGAGSRTGEDIKDGLLLAVDEIDSRGGINGRKIELIIEDSKPFTHQAANGYDFKKLFENPILHPARIVDVELMYLRW